MNFLQSSGIRVFFDYIASLKGGHLNDVELISKELEYSEIEPFKSLGRYIHYVHPTQLGIKEKMMAAGQILDRAGVVKTERVNVESSGGLFILPPKQQESDA